MRYDHVDGITFAMAMGEARPKMGDRRLCVAMPEDTERADFLLAEDRLSGFAVDMDGTFCAVWVHPDAADRPRLPEMIGLAEVLTLSLGLTKMSLDCFDPLVRVYARYGFTETGRLPFNWAFAPEGWRGDMGTPDVVFMERDIVAAGWRLVDTSVGVAA